VIKRYDSFPALPGISVYQTSLIRRGSGICLPGIGIFIHKEVKGEHFRRLVQHEYGHFLDFKNGLEGKRITLLGSAFLGFYLLIGLPSLLNLTAGFRLLSPFKGDHRTFWTELRANRLAKEFFGKELAPNFERYFPIE
jgi:hypothetical protein